MHQAQPDAGRPARQGGGGDRLPQSQGDGQHDGCPDQRGPQGDLHGPRPRPRSLHRQEVARVPEGHRDREQIAQQGVCALGTVRAQGHGDRAAHGQSERQHEQPPRCLLEHHPAEQGDHHRRQVAQHRGVGDRGHDQAVVPEAHVRREEQARQDHPPRRPTPAGFRTVRARAGGQGQEHGQGEGQPPEASGRRTRPAEPNQNGRQTQQGGGQQQDDQGEGSGRHGRHDRPYRLSRPVESGTG